MRKRQTRRSISVKAQTYVRLENYARRQGRSVSGIVEELVDAMLERAREPVVDRAEALLRLAQPREERRSDAERRAGHIFTF